ncbi:hypothetical protein vseg_010949 [Gypsophila vaccaria]
MVSSDDEEEEAPKVVSQYYFEDDKQEPISFASLPVCWNTSDAVQGLEKKIYVRGKTDNGLHNLYEPVKAWKFDISGIKPEISVLSERNNWIKLQKPRISYEEFSRTVLVTVNFLHLVRRNPKSHGKDLWDKLSNIFRMLDEKPSPDDLIDHKAIIEKAVEHDNSLTKSNYFMACLEKNLQKRNIDQENARSKGKSSFIVDDDDEVEEGGSVTEKDGSVDGEDGSSDEEEADDEMFDSVCFICDEGGSILCCDGICMRSFHATPRAAKEAGSKCISLGFSTTEVEAMQSFKCQNCQHKQHQCYSCGLLGSSDKESGSAEVFQCVNATCGYFYHPRCVAKQIHSDNEEACNVLQKDIAAGESFTCPLHVCSVCRQPGDKTDSESRLAVCRRCPKAYHKKCLPRKIAFEDEEDESIVQRAWDNLLADRILIYCLKHKIDEDLGTPLRNHIKFPGDEKKEFQPSTHRMIKNKDLQKNKSPLVALSRPRPVLKPKSTLPDDRCKTERKIFKQKGTDKLRTMSLEKKPVSTKVELKSPEPSDLVKPRTSGNLPAKMPVVELDSDSERRILELIDEASSKITLDAVIAKHEKLLSSGVYKQRMDPCKSITKGKVEGFCKAVRAASSKLEAGGSIEDAKAICEPKILDQVVKWKNKLRVYLAPFIYGMRYTSYGRHFTQPKKLEEIVDKVHCYINENDTVVDFCCGSNDFSRIMKRKLESEGKTCKYKNYDIFQPKDDFCFEKRNWFKVQPNELPPGSELIMGLNPPFGVKAAFANQFINKALEFKPKLLILIVPQETERLDKKKLPYDLVWEDRDLLSGRSFYLPGSVDVNDNQMDDWNIVAPVLYLWSRPDWTAKHKAIAKKSGHQLGEENEGNHSDRPGPQRSSEKFNHAAETKVGNSVFPDEPEQLQETAAAEKQMVLKDHLRESRNGGRPVSRKFNGDSRKKRRTEEIHAKEDAQSSREYKRHRASPHDRHQGWPHDSPINSLDENLSPSSRYQRSSADLEIRDRGQAQFEPISRYRDGRYSQESQPNGYDNRRLSVMEIRDPAPDHFNSSAVYGGTRSGLPVEGTRYDDRVGIHTSQHDMHVGGRWPADAGLHAGHPLRISSPPMDFPSQIPGEWPPASYMRSSSSHDAIQSYSEPEHRFRPSAFPTEADYNRPFLSGGRDDYNPRYPEQIHGRINSYDPELGPRSGPGPYNHTPMQGYPGRPMGFASAPARPFHPPHGSGGWITD